MIEKIISIAREGWSPWTYVGVHLTFEFTGLSCH